MNITSLKYIGGNPDTIAAIVAMMAPFGSLTEGVDGLALAELMLRWCDQDGYDLPALAGSIVGALWGSETEDKTSVMFKKQRVELVTPTSSTRITVGGNAAGQYYLGVEFPTPSTTRALCILGRGFHSGVKFDARGEAGELLPRQEVVSALLDSAEEHLEWVEGLPSTHYMGNEAARKAAEQEVVFYENML